MLRNFLFIIDVLLNFNRIAINVMVMLIFLIIIGLIIYYFQLVEKYDKTADDCDQETDDYYGYYYGNHYCSYGPLNGCYISFL